MTPFTVVYQFVCSNCKYLNVGKKTLRAENFCSRVERLHEAYINDKSTAPYRQCSAGTSSQRQSTGAEQCGYGDLQ